ncbi:MAG: indole-3-glycerol phosphate synthase TrpC [Actinomycetota bacterium]
MGFLSDLVRELRERLDREPLDASALLQRAMASPPPRPFEDALRSASPAVIAEVKRASPSAGPIADRDPADQARAYEAGGASAISVLTEPRHFDGSLADLRAVRTSVGLPVLRKDFLIDPAQVIESRAAGADAVLLIAACVSAAELEALVRATDDLAMAALVETHADEDLDKALGAGARIVGVNARDLETLEVDTGRALRALRRVPEDRLAVFESGIRTRADVEAAVGAGASAILVGEALMRAVDPGRTIGELVGAGREARGA